MDSARLRRAAIALVAAYAMALQALLLPAAPAVPAAATAFAALCPGDGAGGHPAQHEWPCASACTALGQCVGGIVPPETAVAIAEPVATIRLAAFGQWIAPIVLKGPQVPRGPPSV
jgi:hypothetical protein